MKPAGDVTRLVFLVLFIAMLLAGSFWTLLPFLGGLIWAATVVIATWPLLIQLRARTGRPWVAVTVMTASTLLAVILPFAFAVSTLLDVAHRGPELLADFFTKGLGPPPEWLGRIPAVGTQLVAKWQEIAAGGRDALIETARPYVGAATHWLVAVTGGIGVVAVNILLTVALVAILFVQGETAARGALAFGYRLGGERGMQVMRLAAQAVRSVALGVVVTALVQSVLTGIALWICGIPAPAVLAALVFVLGIAQLGPLPVMLPAIAWLYWTDQAVWGTVLLVLAIPIGALDNVLRPILIRRGVQLPMLLIIAGVIGGLIAFGVMGLFVGPVILAASYTLVKSWVAEGGPPPLQATTAPAATTTTTTTTP
jgi:predicted PurR-regulated permease PerM